MISCEQKRMCIFQAALQRSSAGASSLPGYGDSVVVDGSRVSVVCQLIWVHGCMRRLKFESDD